MIDPYTHMPMLQCYTCYNVTTPALGANVSRFGVNRRGFWETWKQIICRILNGIKNGKSQ